MLYSCKNFVRYAHNWNDGILGLYCVAFKRIRSYAFLTINPLFQYSIIPCRRYKTSVAKSTMLSIFYRSAGT